MVMGCVVGMLFFARPSVSETENRALTKYPDFTIESFLKGAYFTDVSLWYADTYPLREPMVGADRAMKSLFGMSMNEGMVGGNVVADEIPVDEPSNAAQPQPTEKPTGLIEAPNEREIAEAVQDSIMEGLYVKDGKAYSIYYFDQSGADTYIAAVNEAAKQLDGVATVYSVIVPTSVLALPDEEAAAVGGSDQRQVFDYVWTRFNDNVKHVDLYETMKSHRGENIFFMTDHHWTQLGAYYGYVELCKAKGIEPTPLDKFSYRYVGKFNGSYEDVIGKISGAVDDDVDTWTPTDTNELVSYQDGTQVTIPIVQDSTNWPLGDKYTTFLDGDNHPLQIITNPNKHDGSACLVVRDSYGCPFVPFLVGDYETIHIIDLRAYEEPVNICDYVREHHIQDVVFLYGIKLALNDFYASLIWASIAK